MNGVKEDKMTLTEKAQDLFVPLFFPSLIAMGWLGKKLIEWMDRKIDHENMLANRSCEACEDGCNWQKPCDACECHQPGAL